MGKLNLSLALVLAFSSIAYADDDVAPTSVVTLQFTVPTSNAPVRTPFVSGSINSLCVWRAKCLPLTLVTRGNGRSLYEARVQVPANVDRFEYKFSLGHWRSEAKDAGAQGYKNFVWTRASNQNTLVADIAGFANNALPADIEGNLEEVPYFASRFLKHHRTLYMWTPELPASQRVECYQVLFAHDGENLFTKSDSNFGAEWKLDETLSTAIDQDRIRPTLVIATDSTAARFEEYHYDFEGADYGRFLIEEVYPFVAGRYPLCKGRANTFVMGSSRGGLVSFGLLYRHSEFFSKAAALSMHLAIRHPPKDSEQDYEPEPLFHRIFIDLPKPAQPIDLYMDHGDKGLDAYYFSYASYFKDLFEHELPSSKITYKTFVGAAHTESDWAERLPEILESLMP